LNVNIWVAVFDAVDLADSISSHFVKGGECGR